MRSAHYPREDPELLPAERQDAAGMPRRGGLPTNFTDAGAAWTLPPAPPSTDVSVTCLPTPEGCLAAPFHHLYLKGHKQPSDPRRHDLSGSAPASLDSCRMEGGVHTPWRPWAWRSRWCPLETCASTQRPLRSCPPPPGEPLKPPTLSRAKDQPPLGGRCSHCLSPRLLTHHVGQPAHGALGQKG